MKILMQQTLILNLSTCFIFSVVITLESLRFEGINRKATTKTLGTRDVMKQTKRGGLDPTANYYC
jgi:hypothetical protein